MIETGLFLVFILGMYNAYTIGRARGYHLAAKEYIENVDNRAIR